MSRALGCEIKSIADYRTGFLVKPFTASDTESYLAVTNRKVSDFHGRKKSFGLKDMSRGGYRGKILFVQMDGEHIRVGVQFNYVKTVKKVRRKNQTG